MKNHIPVVALLLVGCATPPTGRWIQTTEGRMPAQQIGVVLPHEHVFTDLRGPETPGYGEADPEDVVRVMKPLLVAARAQGVDLLVECTTIGVGRNVPVIARLARETGLRIMVPTGVYGRAQFAPRAYRDMDAAQLTEWMVKEIRDGIEGTGIRAGFIKIASSEKELTALEEKFLRAAARASRQTGAVIASHTTSGKVAEAQVEILHEEAVRPDRFIWVHAQAEADLGHHLRLAARGAYIELDSVGASSAGDEKLIVVLKHLIAAGHTDRILLSQDAGWYNPGQPNGGTQRPYTELLDSFVPRLRAGGLDEQTIRRLTVENPRNAFALKDNTKLR